MSRILFIFLLFFLSVIRPFISILVLALRPFIPFIQKRLSFERKNFGQESALPHISSDYCFEISSEGELEQVRELLQALISAGKKIEILYSSPSVESKCQKFFQDYPSQIRVFRMPLLTSFPFDFLYFKSVWCWVKSPVIIFCRYDFFPELLMMKLFGKKFILLSGAFKKTSWYKSESFKFFDVVVAATELEKRNFQNLLGAKSRVYNCDFRVPRIAERFLKASETLSGKAAISSYLDKLRSLADNQKIILGSVWVSDLDILENESLINKVKKGELHLLLAPHKLDDDFAAALKLRCDEVFQESLAQIVNEKTPYKGAPVVILQMGGILCELYSLFKVSYVGGGYERSIHSVLEPFFSNNMVVTGPIIHRSTEFDLALEIAPDEIHVLKNPESFYTIIESVDLTALDIRSRDKFLTSASQEMKLIIADVLKA